MNKITIEKDGLIVTIEAKEGASLDLSTVQKLVDLIKPVQATPAYPNYPGYWPTTSPVSPYVPNKPYWHVLDETSSRPIVDRPFTNTSIQCNTVRYTSANGVLRDHNGNELISSFTLPQ